MFPQELECCWECRECFPHEYIINDTICKACPFGEWPDTESATWCEPLEAEYLKLDYWVTILILITAGAGLSASIIITYLFHINQDKKIVKATSPELCSVLLVGIILAFAASVFYALKPTFVICVINRHGFNLAVAFIYAPLLIKTNRIYRIFKITQKGLRGSRFSDARIMLLLTAIIILTEVGIFQTFTNPLRYLDLFAKPSTHFSPI